MNAPIDVLLSRLDGVRASGDGRWMARCPSHEDRSPSLSIRETADGRVLVHCFAGCAAVDIVDAVGLSLSNLFPGYTRTDHRTRGNNGKWIERQRQARRDGAIRTTAHCAAYIWLAVEQISLGEPLTAQERNALAEATGRVQAAADVLWDTDARASAGGAK